MASLSEGGTDTSVAQLLEFILDILATIIPRVFEDAQSELDRTRGGRLLAIEDKGLLQKNISGTEFKETFRWLLYWDLPHATARGVDYCIPEDATILMNV